MWFVLVFVVNFVYEWRRTVRVPVQILLYEPFERRTMRPEAISNVHFIAYSA